MTSLQDLKTEKNQLNTYIVKLQKEITDHQDSWTDYDPYSPISTYMMQMRYMQQYRAILEYRITVLENAGGN